MFTARRSISVTLALAACVLACNGDASSPDAAAVYEVAVESGDGVETFRIGVDAAARIDEANRLLASGERRNVSGDLASGDGGVNGPYHWHLRPATVAFPEVTIELCDGRPGDVEQNLDYWLGTVKQYCPWGASITRRIR